MTNETFCVGFTADELQPRAKTLAQQLNLTLNNQGLPRLSLTPDKLVLLSEGFLPLYADFSSLTLQQRRDAGKKQAIVRACKPGKGLKIIDATAGWGRDAGVLASFGAQVLMLERNPIVAALLTDALSRPDCSPALSLSLLCTDARQYLHNLPSPQFPDIIYIDPMHPLRQKSALVKKDMQVLQRLLGAEDDAQALIKQAIDRASRRVVVKWPQRLPALIPPDMSIEGKTVRFDIYLMV